MYSVIKLVKSVDAWGSPYFEAVFKNEIQGLAHAALPLQQGLAQSSVVSDTPFSVVVLQVSEIPQHIRVKAGMIYNGIIAGSCCADDPTPVCEQTEYCELQFDIDLTTAQTSVVLLNS